MGAIVLAHVAARRACPTRIGNVDAKAHAARDDHDLLRLGVDSPELGVQAQPSLLRHDQQFAVGIVEVAILHRPVGGVHMNGAARHRGGIAVAGHRDQPFEKVGRCGGCRQRVPAHLVGRRGHVAEAADDAAVVDPGERRVHRGRPDPVGPRAPVRGARRCERRARQLLRVQAVGRALRRIAPDRQCAGQRLGGEFVAESGLIGRGGLVARRRMGERPVGACCLSSSWWSRARSCRNLCAQPPATTSARAAAMASRRTSRSPTWLASNRMSLALTSALCSSVKSRCSPISSS